MNRTMSKQQEEYLKRENIELHSYDGQFLRVRFACGCVTVVGGSGVVVAEYAPSGALRIFKLQHC